MGREDVVKFVESEFHITPQSSWVDYFVNKKILLLLRYWMTTRDPYNKFQPLSLEI